jgi:hypothetical protein
MKIIKKETKNKLIALRLDQKTLECIKKIAKKNKCSVSEVIRQIISSMVKFDHEDQLPL